MVGGISRVNRVNTVPGTLHVEQWGAGEPVVLVHGSISTGPETWEQQRSLAEQGYRLVVPDRRGYGGSAGLADAEDYAADARDIADLLGEGAHLVAHSYGGLGALLAAAAHPARVRSLVVVEPPAFGLAAEDPAVRDLVQRSIALWSRTELTDREFLDRFLLDLGAPVSEIPEELLARWAEMAGPLRRGATTWDAEIPIDALASAPYRIAVVSGGDHPAFHAVCEALAAATGARLEVVAGAGHEAQSTGAPFNAVLERHWEPA